jgi:hypothetical protein
VNIAVSDAALARLRELFLQVEGSCEAWADDEVVRRVLIRGAMEYAKSAGKPWDEVQAVSKALRAELTATELSAE